MTRWQARLGIVALAAVPLAFLVLFFVLPVSGMLARGLVPSDGIDLGGFVEVFSRRRTVRAIWFTLSMACAATVLTVLLGVPTAYVLHRLALPGRRVLRALVITPFVLPTVVVGVMFRSLLAPGGPLDFLGLDGSWQAVLAAFVFFNVAVVVRTVGASWEALDPRAGESAATLGASPWTVFRTVTLPGLLPSILSAAIVVFLFCSTAFGVVLTLGGMRWATVESEIYLLTMTLLDLRGAAALGIVQILAVVLMLWLSGLARARTEKARGTTGARSAPVRVTRATWPVLGVAAATVAFLLLPIGALVVRSLRREGAWTLDNFRDLGTPSPDHALAVTVWQALSMSWRVAVDAALLAVVLGVAVSFVVSRRPRGRTGRHALAVVDAGFMLPLGVSAVTVGLGMLITLDRPPLDLRSSPMLVPIAQAVVAMPLVVRTVAPALRAIDDRQRQAAAALGASPLRVLLTVDLPIVWRPVLAASGFALAVSLGEFGATSFLSRPEAPTLPVVIYQLVGHPGAASFGMALAASVVLGGVTVLVLGLVERLRVDRMGAF